MKQYKELLQHILTNGTDHSDRTGVGTKSVFGYQNRYALDPFPILTTKRIAFGLVISELLWFISGSTDNFDLLDDNNHIWDAWATKEQCAKFGREEGDLGPIYGKQWRSWDSNKFIKVKPRIVDIDDQTIEAVKLQESNLASNDKFVGKRFDTKYGTIVVLDVSFVKKSRPFYKIQFISNGCIRNNISRQSIKTGLIKNNLIPSVCDIGCPGMEDATEHFLYQRWCGLIKRCYDGKHIGFSNYGSKDVFVCKRWLNFSNFIEDVKLISGYNEMIKNPDEYELDKDYYLSNCYSKDTCVWIKRSVNTSLTGDQVISIDGDGKSIHHLSLREAERVTGVCRPSIISSINSNREYKGYIFKNPEHILRPKLRLDQLREIVELIRKDPNSRRIVMSAWNPDDVNDMALMPCHALFQFYVRDGYLSCQLYQRSADSFLGVGFNISSYALLTCMIAHVCDLKPKEFIHTFGDLHIYNNHFSQVDELLSRDCKPLPKLVLNPELKNTGFEGLLKFKQEDIKLEGYDPHPPIKAEVAV